MKDTHFGRTYKMNLTNFKHWLNGHDISDRKLKGEINRKEYERQMEQRGSIIATVALVTIILFFYLLRHMFAWQ